LGCDVEKPSQEYEIWKAGELGHARKAGWILTITSHGTKGKKEGPRKNSKNFPVKKMRRTNTGARSCRRPTNRGGAVTWPETKRRTTPLNKRSHNKPRQRREEIG